MKTIFSFLLLTLLSSSFLFAKESNKSKSNEKDLLIEAAKSIERHQQELFNALGTKEHSLKELCENDCTVSHQLIQIADPKQHLNKLASKHQYNSHSLEWPIFAKCYGAEHFWVRFPKAPAVVDTGETIAFSSLDYSTYPPVLYGLNFHTIPFSYDPHAIFEMILQNRTTWPNELMKYSIEVIDGYWTLDMKLKNMETGVKQKERVIVTPYDVYLLYTLYIDGAKEKHKYFIHSFDLHQ